MRFVTESLQEKTTNCVCTFWSHFGVNVAYLDFLSVLDSLVPCSDMCDSPK